MGMRMDCSIIWLAALEGRLQCGMKLTQDTTDADVVRMWLARWLGGSMESPKTGDCAWWLFIFALTATNTTMK